MNITGCGVYVCCVLFKFWCKLVKNLTIFAFHLGAYFNALPLHCCAVQRKPYVMKLNYYPMISIIA
uniref:Uncharacterized protein n=1 Tax=Glossina palpalis gambiensis TaxID=67801 RepID=A0A1B0BLD5_9MUSC